MSAISNWKHFHSPGEPLSNFTKSEPVSDEMKDTYVTKKRKKHRRVQPGHAFEVLMRKERRDGR